MEVLGPYGAKGPPVSVLYPSAKQMLVKVSAFVDAMAGTSRARPERIEDVHVVASGAIVTIFRAAWCATISSSTRIIEMTALWARPARSVASAPSLALCPKAGSPRFASY